MKASDTPRTDAWARSSEHHGYISVEFAAMLEREINALKAMPPVPLTWGNLDELLREAIDWMRRNKYSGQ